MSSPFLTKKGIPSPYRKTSLIELHGKTDSELHRHTLALQQQIAESKEAVQAWSFYTKALEHELAYLLDTVPAFRRFSKLPKELQLRIWKYAANEPVRVVLGRQVPNESDRDSEPYSSAELLDLWLRKRPRLKTRGIDEGEYRIPAIFHACRDSRDIGIKHCSPRFFQSERGRHEEVSESLLKTI